MLKRFGILQKLPLYLCCWNSSGDRCKVLVLQSRLLWWVVIKGNVSLFDVGAGAGPCSLALWNDAYVTRSF